MPKEINFTRKQVLERYDIGNTTLYRWLQEGLFPQPVRYGPRTIRWRESDLVDWESDRAEATQ